MKPPSPTAPAPPRDRPFVVVNMAVTADGKTAPADEPFLPFGGKRDEAHLYSLRAGSDAILCGAATLNSGRVALDTGGARRRAQRKRHGLAPDPIRILVSGRGGLNPEAHVFQHQAGPILVWTTQACPRSRVAAYESLGAQVEIHGAAELDFRAALRQLKARHKVGRLICEGGGRLNSSLFDLGCVDELHLSLCPLILAGSTAPSISDGPGAGALAQAHRMRWVSCKQRGGVVFLVCRPLVSGVDESGPTGE
jgi:riboflavin-specific deaminase-like protein